MRIAIMGVGKMGSWFARSLSAGHDVAVYDRDPARTESLKGVKVLAADGDVRGFNPELLINAVSLEHTTAAFDGVMPYVPTGCIVCDIASIKGQLSRYYENSPCRFVSLHPMFGPTFTDMTSLVEEAVIIIEESDREGARFFTRFFEDMKVSVSRCSFTEHDEMMAYSLTLPFVSSLAFAACVDGTPVPGTTFAKHRLVARGLLSEDDRLLAEILFNPCSVEQVERITGKLEHLKHIMKGNDYEELERFLARSRENVSQTGKML